MSERAAFVLSFVTALPPPGCPAMLQQILRDLHVPPEILAGLDEQQRQTLFCRMREEQVRRWKAWVDSDPPKPPPRPAAGKSVSFLRGADGEPWVWVMGEHEDDRSIGDILRDEARRLAEEEALRNLYSSAEELDRRPPEEAPYRYHQARNLRDPPKAAHLEDIYSSPPQNNFSFSHYHQARNTRCAVVGTKEVANDTQKVARKVEMWERRLTEKTCEIFQRMQRRQAEDEREAEELERRQETLWREQGEPQPSPPARLTPSFQNKKPRRRSNRSARSPAEPARSTASRSTRRPPAAPSSNGTPSARNPEGRASGRTARTSPGSTGSYRGRRQSDCCRRGTRRGGSW